MQMLEQNSSNVFLHAWNGGEVVGGGYISDLWKVKLNPGAAPLRTNGVVLSNLWEKGQSNFF